MKKINVVALILSFALLSSANAFADEVAPSSSTVITTSKGTLTLTPPGSLISEGALKSAGRTAEIAAGELTKDLRDFAKEETALVKEIAAYQKVHDAEQAAWDIIKAKYDKRKGEYEAVLAPLSAEILAYNALPENQRDEGTHAALAERKALADAERDSLEVERVDGEKSKEEGEARLSIISVPLELKLSKWNSGHFPKMGLAYRQLKLVVEYAKQVNIILSERYPAPWAPEGKHPGYNGDGKYFVLDKAMEQIKDLSSHGFDTN